MPPEITKSWPFRCRRQFRNTTNPTPRARFSPPPFAEAAILTLDVVGAKYRLPDDDDALCDADRVQTVDADRHAIYYELLKRFEEKIGCPVVINTSFNIRGEPIVGTPEDA